MRWVFLSTIIATCFIPVIAVSQAPKDASKNGPKGNVPAPVLATPERTTASFGDWTLRCETAITPAKRFCEVVLVITLQGQSSPAAQIAIGKQAPAAANSITVALPANISIGTRPQVSIAKAGAAPLELTWQRCTPGACFASGQVSDEIINSLKGQTEPGRVQFKDAADRDLAFTLSFRGLSQALAALAKEP